MTALITVGSMTSTPAELTLNHVSVSDMDNNCYLLCADGQGLLIDAAAEPNTLLSLASDSGVEITDVLTTHRHWDHVGALEEILERTSATHWGSYLDAPALPVWPDVELHEGDTVPFAGHQFPAHILRGHTPGGVAIAAEIEDTPNLFVGDSLFPGGLGKTNGEGDFVRLFNDVKLRIFDIYPDEAIVWPGHGAPTTLGEERPKLDEWWERRW